MRVRLTNQVSGTRNGQEWPEAGTEIDLPDDEARALIAGDNAVDVKADQHTVMVPPAGVHTPASAAAAQQVFVEAPADAVSDPDGTANAMRAARENDVTEVPAGVGVQRPNGQALTPDELQDSVKAEKDTRKAFADESPKVGEKKTADKK